MVYSLKLFPKCYVKNTTCILFSICLCIVLHLWIMRDILNLTDNLTSILSIVTRNEEANVHLKGYKLILLWDHSYLILKSGKSPLTGLNCPISNCIFAAKKNILGNNYTRFDAILFSEYNLNKAEERPLERRNSQLYIYSTLESAHNYPACDVFEDNFYNWTFTYRLDSDFLWSYFIVTDANGVIVAPSHDVNWKHIPKSIPPHIETIISGKTKAAAWLVSNCKANSFRNDYLSILQEHLYQYSLKIDVYGRCSKSKCTNNDCNTMLQKDYYFYMAFENSFAEDYVTEKVLHGYKNYVVPIVYGGANYTRFLPPGSYINARELHPHNLAHTIYQAIKHPKVYQSYFRWTNYYSIFWDEKVYHPLCNLCAALNSEKAKHAPAKKDFRLWWNTLNGMKWCLSDEFWKEASKINIDGSNFISLY